MFETCYYYLQVAINDGSPERICHICIPLLHIAYVFKLRFDHSYAVLQKHFVSNLNNVLLPEKDDQSNNETVRKCITHPSENKAACNFIQQILKSQKQNLARNISSQKQSKCADKDAEDNGDDCIIRGSEGGRRNFVQVDNEETDSEKVEGDTKYNNFEVVFEEGIIAESLYPTNDLALLGGHTFKVTPVTKVYPGSKTVPVICF